MSELLNSIWPNGIKKDAEGYSVYYPLGTNKIDIPDGSKWPKGTKLKFPFVYDENGQLTGFCDTKSMIANSGTNIYLPYEEIEADFSSIDKGTLGIHAPNATVKKAIWQDSEEEDIPEAQFKYKGCKTLDDVKAKIWNYDYLADVANGTWSEPLWDLTSDVDYMFNNYNDLFAFESDLPNLTDGGYMFQYCRNLASFNGDLSNLSESHEMFFFTDLKSWDIDLPKLIEGNSMFYGCKNLASFKSDLPNLTKGNSMFNGCENLSSFEIDLPNLTDGGSMFFKCNLSNFDINLSKLTSGDNMFYRCENLSSFDSDLSNLTYGSYMFSECKELSSFKTSNLNNLDYGSFMFYCTNLASFDYDMPKLKYGNCMFCHCYNLTSFKSDLSELTHGLYMFESCKLDAASVKNIIDTINTYKDDLTLGFGCNNTTEDKDLFAQEVGYADMTSLLTALQDKSWRVTAQYNGRPTTTYGLRRPLEDTLPVFIKLEEIGEDEKYAGYISLDDSKKYKLIWFHETTGSTEGYTQFNSLEEAIEYFNIKPIERN